MLAQYLVFIKKLQYVTVTRTIFTSVAFFDSFTYMSFAALMPDSSPTNQEPSPQSIEWALKLFSKSPLKQQKLRRIESLCPKFSGKICLDIGSDNGVISLKLREQGGVWYSADLLPETVASIQSLVGERVSQIDGQKLPYVDDQFDLVVIVDFLEHIDTDRKCVEEISRILKPGAELIINVPNPQKGLLRSIKHLIGQTDEAHGHVRPGYSIDQLNKLLDGLFVIESHQSYFRVFSDLIDTSITFALDILKGKRGRKGTVVTSDDLTKLKKSFKLYSLIYPIVAFVSRLDSLVPFLHGSMLVVKARNVKGKGS